jgi:(R,R)-butanediol dehydrogenase / meso-butanediol dehydrogenase / diacetyl reductase
MKALRIYGKKDIRYEDVSEVAPGPGEVKIRVSYAGICGSDLKEYAYFSGMITKLPQTIGHEYSGTISELGSGVTNFKIGDRVAGVGFRYCGKCYYCRKGIYNLCSNSGFTGISSEGGMADYIVTPIYSIYKLPDTVSDEFGAVVEPLAVSIHAIHQGNVQKGDTVVIIGDGTIGLYALLAARVSGANKVFVVSKHRSRGTIASKMGANRVLYLGEGNLAQTVMDLTDGVGADVAVDSAGNQDSLPLAMNLTRRGGTVSLVAFMEKPVPMDCFGIAFNEKKLVGSLIYVNEGAEAVALLANKSIDPSPPITSIIPMKNAVELGFEKLLKDKENNLKILLKP